MDLVWFVENETWDWSVSESELGNEMTRFIKYLFGSKFKNETFSLPTFLLVESATGFRL